VTVRGERGSAPPQMHLGRLRRDHLSESVMQDLPIAIHGLEIWAYIEDVVSFSHISLL